MTSYDKLDAYRAAVEFNKIVRPLIAKIRRHSDSNANQFERAADSMEDNSAEGGTATTPAKKANHFRIGRDSGGECNSQLNRARRNGWITDNEWTVAQLALNKPVFLLNRLALKWEREAAEEETQRQRKKPRNPRK